MVKIIIGGSNFVQFSEWFCLELGVFLFFGVFLGLFVFCTSSPISQALGVCSVNVDVFSPLCKLTLDL